MRKTKDILGVAVDDLTMSSAIDRIKEYIERSNNHTVYTPNAEIIMEAQSSSELMSILNDGDMVTPDGAGVVLASKILGRKLTEKVSGVDLVKNVMASDYHRKIRFFLFGAAPGVAEKAAQNILNTYPNVEIAGLRNGYYTPADETSILNDINESGADILLVALGAPRQERFIHTHKSQLKVKVSIGVGGTIDILAGTVKLAPDFFRRNGLEWLYRLCKQPSRFKRMLRLPRFIIKVIMEKLKKG